MDRKLSFSNVVSADNKNILINIRLLIWKSYKEIRKIPAKLKKRKKLCRNEENNEIY